MRSRRCSPAEHDSILVVVGRLDRLLIRRLLIRRLGAAPARVVDDLDLRDLRSECFIDLGDTQDGIWVQTLNLLQKVAQLHCGGLPLLALNREPGAAAPCRKSPIGTCRVQSERPPFPWSRSPGAVPWSRAASPLGSLPSAVRPR
jgi:hypothetical protein